MRRVVHTTTTDLAKELSSSSSIPALIVGAFETESGTAEFGNAASDVEKIIGMRLASIVASDREFTGEVGQCVRAAVPSKGDGVNDAVLSVVVVGLGPLHALTPDGIRSASFRAARECKDSPMYSTLALQLHTVTAATAVAEGTLLGDYRYRFAEPTSPLHVVIDADIVDLFVPAVVVATTTAEATTWVRRLVETPGRDLGPQEFAQAIVDRVNEHVPGQLTATIWTVEDMQSRGFGATLAVGSGSVRDAAVVELRTTGADGAAPVALAGKGVTFDAGGINLKRDESELAWMKSDMAAAAAVAAATIAAVRLGATIPIHTILPLVENMPAGDALRPGDVVTHPDGRTTEVIDTDCEGRLILADAVAWLASTKPRVIVDVGTLTDSGDVGTALWGCWSVPLEAGRALVAAGESSGDRGWLLPLVPSYRAFLESDVADSTNTPIDGPDSGHIAATYLEQFTGGVPWAHIDNGSGAYLERDCAEWTRGATGTPTRALINYLLSFRD